MTGFLWNMTLLSMVVLFVMGWRQRAVLAFSSFFVLIEVG